MSAPVDLRDITAAIIAADQAVAAAKAREAQAIHDDSEADRLALIAMEAGIDLKVLLHHFGINRANVIEALQ